MTTVFILSNIYNSQILLPNTPPKYSSQMLLPNALNSYLHVPRPHTIVEQSHAASAHHRRANSCRQRTPSSSELMPPAHTIVERTHADTIVERTHAASA